MLHAIVVALVLLAPPAPRPHRCDPIGFTNTVPPHAIYPPECRIVLTPPPASRHHR